MTRCATKGVLHMHVDAAGKQQQNATMHVAAVDIERVMECRFAAAVDQVEVGTGIHQPTQRIGHPNKAQ